MGRRPSVSSKKSRGAKKGSRRNLYPNTTTKNFRTTEEELAQIRNQYKLIRKFQFDNFILNF